MWEEWRNSGDQINQKSSERNLLLEEGFAGDNNLEEAIVSRK